MEAEKPKFTPVDRTTQIRHRMLKMQLMDVINALEDTVYEAQLEYEEFQATQASPRAAGARVGGRFAIAQYNSGIQPMVTFIVDAVIKELGDDLSPKLSGSAIYAKYPDFSEFVGDNMNKLGDVVNALYIIRAALD